MFLSNYFQIFIIFLKTPHLDQYIAKIVIFSIEFLFHYSHFIMNNIDYIYPPDKEKAYRHRLAYRIFKGIDQNQQPTEECTCCGRKVGAQDVETSCNIQPTQLSFLGPGAPLFFHFLRYIIGLLAIMVVVFVSFSVISNAISSDCQSANSCIADGFTLLSIINKSSNTTFLSVQSYISLCFVILTILYFHYFRYKARQLQEQCDEITNSPSDYAIILRRLPQNIVQSDIQQSIQVFKNELISQGNEQARQIKVVKIILSYSLREYSQIKQQNLQQFRKCVKQDKLNEFKPKELITSSQISKIAIVVFDLQQTKDLFIYKPNIGQSILRFFCTACTPKSNLIVKGQRVGVERAPEPDQICWENSGITMLGSICRKTLYTVIAIIILLLGGGAQYGLQLLSLSTQDSTAKSLLGIASSVIVTIFNAVILITLQITTKRQRAQTLTQFQASLMVKITLAQFFNAGIFVLIAQIGATYTTFSLQTSNIVSQISLIMILDAIVPNSTLFFLNYFEIIQRVKRFLIEKDFIIASQKELNQLYISPVIDLPSKYAYVLKTLWLTGLYSPMIPIVVVIALIGLIINYFLQKFLFTKCYSMPNTLSSIAFQSALELLEYFLISFAIGQFIIYAYFYNYKVDQIPIQWTITILVTIALALLNSALPMQAINQKLFVIEGSSKSELTYGQVENSFEVTYEMSNPAYKVDRKRKDNKNNNLQAFSSVKSKQKQQEIELANLMQNKRNQNNYISNQPLLKDFGNPIPQVQEVSSSKEQSAILKSPKLLLNSNKMKQNQLESMSNPNKIKLLTNQQVVSKEQKQNDLKVKNTSSSVQANNQKRLKRTSPEQQLKNRQAEIEKIKKKNALQAEEKALSKFKYVEIKQIKNKQPWNYQIKTSKLQYESKHTQIQDHDPIPQSALIFDPKIQKNDQYLIGQNFKKIIIPKSNSRSSILIEDPDNKRSPIFDDPVKQKKSIYDPIKLSTNYRNFFSDLQSMKQKEGKYLNNKYVMSYLGTPFSNLVKKQQAEKPVLEK